MDAVKYILVGIELAPRTQDVTEGSRTAFEQGLRLARELGARLTLLHSVWHEGEALALSEAGRETLDSLRTEGIEADVRTRLDVTEARPWLALLRIALRGEGDVVVVGKRDAQTAQGERRLGSVATKLIRKCPVPVWVVKPAHDLEHKLVLAAVDRSPMGERILEWAGFISGRREADLHVVHAWRLPRDLKSRAGELSPEDYDEEKAALKGEAQAELDGRIAASELVAPANTHLSRKSPAVAIKETVEHLAPDLLVMGSLSRGGRTGVQVGETAERLLGRLDCSVLWLKPEDFVSPVSAD
jgi:universal stress protein E